MGCKFFTVFLDVNLLQYPLSGAKIYYQAAIHKTSVHQGLSGVEPALTFRLMHLAAGRLSARSLMKVILMTLSQN
jgi:hypothetical protein